MDGEEMEKMDLVVTLCGEVQEIGLLPPGTVKMLPWPLEGPPGHRGLQKRWVMFSREFGRR